MPNATIEIWLMDLAHGSPVPFTNSGGLNLFQVWSPGNDEILFSTFRDGRHQMYRWPVSASSPGELIRSADVSQVSHDWTRYPQRIVYSDQPNPFAGKQSAIVALPLVPGGEPVVIDDSSAVKYGTRVSPSGRWVAYASDESGEFEVYVRAMRAGDRPAGARIRISTAGGANPAWSADGNTLFYSSPDDRLQSVKLKISGEGLEAGEAKTMFSLGGSSAHNGAIYWEPIGNGERFVVLRPAPVTGRDNRINILLNWQSGLN